MPRDVGDWTEDKLKLLRLYLPGYLQATTDTLDRIYIDGFAGPGQNRLRRSGDLIDGSPIIALDARAMDTPARFTKLYFIERDPQSVTELRQLVEARGGDERVVIVEGDVNVELPRIVRNHHPRAPMFVLLDTEGIEPRWSTIQQIAAWRTELLVNFPLGMAINRNPESTKVDDYFGVTDWKSLLDRGDVRGMLDLYKGRLSALGYVEQVENDRLINTQGGFGQHLYYLIPASKVPAAKDIWNWVLNQPDARGQGRFQDF